MITNKQTIDSNAVSKVFNRKRWTGQSFSKLKTPANIVKREYLYVCVRHVTFFISTMCGWVWPSFGWVWPFLFRCGWVLVSVTYFLAKCEWVWVSVTFFWLGVSGCGWVWVSARFVTAHCFYMNTNIWRDFQICINVPLRL